MFTATHSQHILLGRYRNICRGFLKQLRNSRLFFCLVLCAVTVLSRLKCYFFYLIVVQIKIKPLFKF